MVPVEWCRSPAIPSFFFILRRIGETIAQAHHMPYVVPVKSLGPWRRWDPTSAAVCGVYSAGCRHSADIVGWRTPAL